MPALAFVNNYFVGTPGLCLNSSGVIDSCWTGTRLSAMDFLISGDLRPQPVDHGNASVEIWPERVISRSRSRTRARSRLVTPASQAQLKPRRRFHFIDRLAFRARDQKLRLELQTRSRRGFARFTLRGGDAMILRVVGGPARIRT